jgi:hypothetical protein
VDCYLSKFDPSGNFLWVKTFGAAGTDEAMGIVITDPSNNVYITGRFTSLNCDFNPDGPVDSHSTNGGQDSFVSKFSENGNFLWAKTWGGSGDDQSRALLMDNSGYLYVAGWYANTVDFDPGSAVSSKTSNGLHDGFVSQFDSSGNINWVKTWGGAGEDDASTLALYGSNLVYTGGSFAGSVDFDPGTGVDIHTSASGQAAYISRY